MWISAALVTGGLAGGAILGSTLSASAATSTSSTSSGSSSSSSYAPTMPSMPSTSMPSMPAHGSAAHEDAETPVTGTAASKAQAAAVKYVGSGTAGAVTTDFTKNGYEVTVTKSDGSRVEVHLDSAFNVVQCGPGHFGGPHDHGSNEQPASSGTAA